MTRATPDDGLDHAFDKAMRAAEHEDELEKLTRDLRDAKAAAQAAAEARDDGGSCNFDNVRLFGFRWSSRIVGAIHAAGVTPHRRHWLRRACIELDFGSFGQAMKNTAACEAARALLRERSWDVSIFYMAD